MTYTAEVQGKADRYRAYVSSKMTRSPNAADHIKRDREGKDPLPLGSRIRYDVEEVGHEGEVAGGSITISAGEGTVNKVVFYSGSVEEETVVGSIDVGASGEVVIDIKEVEPPVVVTGEPVIVDE